jgi:hypothetical protein
MGVTADEQAVGIAAGHVHKLEALEFVGVLAYVEAVGKDDGADLKASALVLAVWGPVPVFGFGCKGFRAHEVGHVSQGLRNAAGVLGAEVVIVVSHDGVEMGLAWEDFADGSEEGCGVSVLVKKGVIVFVRVDRGSRGLEDVAQVYKVRNPIQSGQGFEQPVMDVRGGEGSVGTADCCDAGRHDVSCTVSGVSLGGGPKSTPRETPRAPQPLTGAYYVLDQTRSVVTPLSFRPAA